MMSYQSKKNILKDIGQKELLDIFDNYKPKYKQLNEIRRLKSTGEVVSVSSVVRSRAIGDVDMQSWKERAEIGLKELNSIKWDKPEIDKNIRLVLSQYDELDPDDDESEIVLNKKIKMYEAMLEELQRPTIRRASRMSGRVTFNEANHIRWRAGRLTITVADYMRFLIFGHLPFTENDRHFSIDSRRRFYVSIIDVAENGWGNAPKVAECPNCARYAHENKELRDKLTRLQKMTR